MATNKFETTASLSDREIQIIQLISTGLTNHQIAERLEISKRTVDNHLSNILKKTNTKNRVELLNWALYWGKVCLYDINCCILPVAENQRNTTQVLT
ncbi:MAG: LuxR C-terminal-related transcriptional regulator [Prochloraceae cyanobacterium]|nr:LuxR C-terminal-related transcriptional regulator [Prochloraceae cyanobacterium]